MMGFPVAKSGVCAPSPKPLPFDGSSPLWEPLLSPWGLEMVARLSTSNTSNRNWAPKGSLNVKVLKMERSQFLKPLSRKMFRPILPNFPTSGGVMSELPDTKQPPAERLLVGLVGLSTAVHASPSDVGKLITLLSIPDCFVHVMVPGAKTVPDGKVRMTPQKGMELEPDLNSSGFPKKSQRTFLSSR